MYNKIFQAELSLRWQKIAEAMQQSQADALLVSSNVNLYYTAGRVFSGYIYIAKEQNPLFFVRRPLGLTGDDVVYIRKPEQIADEIVARGGELPKRLMVESEIMPYAEFQRIQKIFQPEEVLNGSALFRQVRTIKTPYEQDLLRESGMKHAALYHRIPSLFTHGMTDTELSIELEREARLHGSLGLFRIFGSSMEIFMGSLLVGDNADAPSPYDFALGGQGLDNSLPVGCNGTIIHPGLTVMVDIGGNFTGYISDMTRTFFVGNISNLAQKAHQTSLDIVAAVEAMAKPNVAAADIYNKALEIAQAAGLSDYFMGHKQKAGFVGHGIGIEINELPVLAPRSKDVLAEGMAFALEPKFVIPQVGAVGVENSYIVTATGVEKITVGNEELVQLD